MRDWTHSSNILDLSSIYVSVSLTAWMLYSRGKSRRYRLDKKLVPKTELDSVEWRKILLPVVEPRLSSR
jgi:hypothetical protein